MKPTITCDICGLEHGLFWRVSSATDRQLSYRCNKVQHQVQTSTNFHQPEFHSFTKILPALVTDSDLAAAEQLHLPEEYTAAYRKAVQAKEQQQFVLMYKEKP